MKPAYQCFNNPTYLKILEMETSNPAPFGDQLLLVDGPNTWAKHVYGQLGIWEDVRKYIEAPSTTTKTVIGDVPIKDIVGIGSDGHLGCHEYPFELGETFRHVFEYRLHGHTLNEACLEYFESDCIKTNNAPIPEHLSHLSYREMPDSVIRLPGGSRGPFDFNMRAGKYITSNGNQRTILGMFFLAAKHGPDAVFKNVGITIPD